VKKEIKILATDHNPVKVGDEVFVNVKLKKHITPHHNIGVSKTPKKLLISLDERIANALTKSLQPVVSRLDNVDKRLDKQDEFNKVVINYMKSHP
jgi:guanylate kinase